MIGKMARKLARMRQIEHARNNRLFALEDLIFAVTYKCDLQCRTCYYAATMDRNHAPELSIKEIARISASLPPFRSLLLSGGEPTLRSDLPEVCAIFCRQNNLQHIHLPSNCSNPERTAGAIRAVVRAVPEVFLQVGLPLDGLEATHDNIRGRRGNFKEVLDTAARLAELRSTNPRLRVYVITTVNSANLHEVEDLAEFVKTRLPVDGHGPSPMRGTPRDKGVRPPTTAEWRKVAKSLVPYHRYWIDRSGGSRVSSSIETNRLRYLYRIYAEILDGKKPRCRCQAGNTVGVLEPDGDIRLCELTPAVGNVRLTDYDFRKAWFSDEAQVRRTETTGCACTHACFLAPSINLDPIDLARSSLCWRV